MALNRKQWTVISATCILLLLLTHEGIATGLWCYRCVSTLPGCGKELSIRLQRWHWCPDPGDGGGENLCVKIVEKYGSEERITRDCLMTVRKHTLYRQNMPTVQRHGYCTHARNNDPDNREDKEMMYCFCNDWNGCNGASGLESKYKMALVLSMLGMALQRWVL